MILIFIYAIIAVACVVGLITLKNKEDTFVFIGFGLVLLFSLYMIYDTVSVLSGGRIGL